MIIYLDYVDKDKIHTLNKDSVQVDDSMFSSNEEAIRYLIKEELYLNDSQVYAYNIEGRYQLLPKNYEGNCKYFKNKEVHYLLEATISPIIDYHNNKELLNVNYRLYTIDNIVKSEGSLSSTDLSNLIDMTMVDLYKVGVSRYNSSIRVNIKVESDKETSTFSTMGYLFRNENESKDYESITVNLVKLSIENALKSYIMSSFGDYNPHIDLTNLLVTIKYGNE